jgi:hypothetical protein
MQFRPFASARRLPCPSSPHTTPIRLPRPSTAHQAGTVRVIPPVAASGSSALAGAPAGPPALSRGNGSASGSSTGGSSTRPGAALGTPSSAGPGAAPQPGRNDRYAAQAAELRDAVGAACTRTHPHPPPLPPPRPPLRPRHTLHTHTHSHTPSHTHTAPGLLLHCVPGVVVVPLCPPPSPRVGHTMTMRRRRQGGHAKQP